MINCVLSLLKIKFKKYKILIKLTSPINDLVSDKDVVKYIPIRDKGRLVEIN